MGKLLVISVFVGGAVSYWYVGGAPIGSLTDLPEGSGVATFCNTDQGAWSVQYEHSDALGRPLVGANKAVRPQNWQNPQNWQSPQNLPTRG